MEMSETIRNNDPEVNPGSTVDWAESMRNIGGFERTYAKFPDILKPKSDQPPRPGAPATPAVRENNASLPPSPES